MQVLNKFTILIIVINTISCTPGKSRFENEIFSFFYPKNWELKDYIISPYKGIITINDTDTLYYNIGMVVSNLSEECKEVFYVPNLDYLEDTSGSNALLLQGEILILIDIKFNLLFLKKKSFFI